MDKKQYKEYMTINRAWIRNAIKFLSTPEEEPTEFSIWVMNMTLDRLSYMSREWYDRDDLTIEEHRAFLDMFDCS